MSSHIRQLAEDLERNPTPKNAENFKKLSAQLDATECRQHAKRRAGDESFKNIIIVLNDQIDAAIEKEGSLAKSGVGSPQKSGDPSTNLQESVVEGKQQRQSVQSRS